MNILIGKFGRSISFDKNKWSMFKGDAMPKYIYFTMAKHHPEDTFYIVGKTDFTEFKEKNSGFFAEEEVPENIIDVYNDAIAELGSKYNFGNKEYSAKMMYQIPGKEPWRCIDEYIEKHNLKFDMGIIMQGPDARVSIMGEGIKKVHDHSQEPKCLQMAALYNGPIRHLLNKVGCPWYSIVDDPRYVPIQDIDVINHPIATLSLCNKDYHRKYMEFYSQNPEEYKEHHDMYRYIPMCKFFLSEKTKVDYHTGEVKLNKHVYKKDGGFLIACNDGYGRLNILKKWVLDIHPEVKIYGKWGDEAKAEFPNTFIEKAMVQMQEDMWRSKYTFIPAFDKKAASFVTPKPWEMIYYGIMPFWDKNGYDVDNLYKEIPDYFKVETPEEMWKKIEEMEQNHDLYLEKLNSIYECLLDKYFSDEYINEIFTKIIDRHRPAENAGSI